MNTLRIQPRRLVLIGSVLVDILMYVDQLPERGGDCIAQRTVLTSGGGFNVLVGAARLGIQVAYAGRVGDGPMGTQVMTDLLAADIPLVLPRVTGQDTGFDVGLVELDAERTFVTAPGVESQLRLADLNAIPLLPGDVIYISGYDLCYPISGAALEQWLPRLSVQNILVVDPGPLVAEIPRERLAQILGRTDILSLNAHEASMLTGTTDAPGAAKLLVSRLAAGGWVVVRVGAQGCWVANETLPPQHLPARPTQAVDTTGAGDAHVAALVARLAAGDDMITAAHVANVAASIAIEKFGPATGPTMIELEEVLSKFFP
ncbi:MAG: PfkB family carbohydrate kinase [Ktedonobacteraceae bacterium]